MPWMAQRFWCGGIADEACFHVGIWRSPPIGAVVFDSYLSSPLEGAVGGVIMSFAIL